MNNPINHGLDVYGCNGKRTQLGLHIYFVKLNWIAHIFCFTNGIAYIPMGQKTNAIAKIFRDTNGIATRTVQVLPRLRSPASQKRLGSRIHPYRAVEELHLSLIHI